MKRVYSLLLQLSLSEQLDLSRNEAALIELNKELSRSGFKESFRDFCGMADFLFKQLDSRFKRVFHDLRSISFSRSPELAPKDNDLWDTVEEFMLLLRSCLVIYTLVAFEQNVLLEKGGVLLSVLRKLLYLITSGEEEKESISLEKSFLHECRITESDCTTFVSEDFVASLCILEPSDPCHPFICAVLEGLLRLKSSETVAMEFQKMQTIHMSTDSLKSCHRRMYDDLGKSLEIAPIHNSGKECTIDVEEAEETCSGEIFLKCLLADSKGTSSYNDISDFVECKRGKDYMQWMKNRQRYRKWKSQKLAVLRWKKKKKVWKCIKTKN